MAQKQGRRILNDSKNYFKGNDMIDLVTIPFSRFGSFFVISKYEIDKRRNIYIRELANSDDMDNTYLKENSKSNLVKTITSNSNGKELADDSKWLP